MTLKAIKPRAQVRAQRAQVTEQRQSPYLTSRGAVAYLQLTSLSALYSHIRENGLPTCRCGGDLRFDVRELDAWLRNELSLPPSERVRTNALAALPQSGRDRDAAVFDSSS